MKVTTRARGRRLMDMAVGFHAILALQLTVKRLIRRIVLYSEWQLAIPGIRNQHTAFEQAPEPQSGF